MCADCSPNLTRLLAAAAVWGANVVWSHSVAVVHYFVVNADGEYVKQLKPLFLSR